MKTHLLKDGKTVCGVIVPEHRLKTDKADVTCYVCKNRPSSPEEMEQRIQKARQQINPDGAEPDYKKRCIVCGGFPVLPITEMCGPCSTGEAATAGGNW